MSFFVTTINGCGVYVGDGMWIVDMIYNKLFAPSSVVLFKFSIMV